MAMGLSRSVASSRPTEGLCRPSTTEPAELSVSDETHRTPLFSSELLSSKLKSPAERGGTLPSSEDVPQGVSGLGSRAIACLLDVSTEIDFLVGEMTVVADDILGPNGLCFSPDESLLYVVESRGAPLAQEAVGLSKWPGGLPLRKSARVSL